MSWFNQPLQRVFVRKEEDGTHFETQVLDGSWTEIVLRNQGDFDVRFHNKKDESGKLISYKPQGDEASEIFRNDPRQESLFVRHLFTSSLIAQNEVLNKILEAMNLLQIFGNRLEDPSDDPSGYTDPVSPIPPNSSTSPFLEK